MSVRKGEFKNTLTNVYTVAWFGLTVKQWFAVTMDKNTYQSFLINKRQAVVWSRLSAQDSASKDYKFAPAPMMYQSLKGITNKLVVVEFRHYAKPQLAQTMVYKSGLLVQNKLASEQIWIQV